MTLCIDRRGEQINLNYVSERHVVVEYRLPLAEVVFDFLIDSKQFLEVTLVLTTSLRPIGNQSLLK